MGCAAVVGPTWACTPRRLGCITPDASETSAVSAAVTQGGRACHTQVRATWFSCCVDQPGPFAYNMPPLACDGEKCEDTSITNWLYSIGCCMVSLSAHVLQHPHWSMSACIHTGIRMYSTSFLQLCTWNISYTIHALPSHLFTYICPASIDQYIMSRVNKMTAYTSLYLWYNSLYDLHHNIMSVTPIMLSNWLLWLYSHA